MKLRTSTYLMLAMLLAVGTLVLGCGGEDETGTDTTDAGEEATTTEPQETETTTGDEISGEQVFADTCATCHGAEGRGGTGADLTALSLSHDEVESQVRNGSGAMPAYGDQLSDDEIRAVAEFVVSEFMGG